VENFHEDCARSLGRQGTPLLEPLRHGTLVVTGGSGFVGLWLATLCTYLNDSHNFGIELVLTARRKARLDQTAPHLSGRRDIRFIASDIRQFIDIPASASWIVHATGSPDNRAHANNPMETMNVISGGTYGILRAAEQCLNLRMLVNLSSAAIYGNQPPDLRTLPEDFIGRVDPATMASAYAEAKRYGESLCASARNQSRTPVIIGRPFTFVGPFQALDAPWAINNFLHSALRQQPLKLLGDGNTRRSFLYGSDAAFLVLRMLTGGASGGIFNIGHSENITLNDLAALVVRKSGLPLDIKTNIAGGRVGTAHLLPDMTRTEQIFGFKPAFSIANSVERTLSWHRARETATVN
jgi:nucleoside-diphosphate-sugar epimerase